MPVAISAEAPEEARGIEDKPASSCQHRAADSSLLGISSLFVVGSLVRTEGQQVRHGLALLWDRGRPRTARLGERSDRALSLLVDSLLQWRCGGAGPSKLVLACVPIVIAVLQASRAIGVAERRPCLCNYCYSCVAEEPGHRSGRALFFCAPVATVASREENRVQKRLSKRKAEKALESTPRESPREQCPLLRMLNVPSRLPDHLRMK